MTTKSLCQQLTDICNLKLYERNPFQVLNLFAFAPKKALRRRREELETAHRLGEEAWNKEFEGCLVHETEIDSPSYELLEKAYGRLDDPLQRIVDEFFWFWPTQLSGEIEWKTPAPSVMEQLGDDWCLSKPDETPRHRGIALHNLAVLNHLRAIQKEQSLLETEEMENVGEGSVKAINEMWKTTFEIWKDVLNDEEVWSIVNERVVLVGDPRVTPAFISRLRDELPRALKKINAYFAVDCIAKMKTGFPGEADLFYDFRADLERHLNYMAMYFPTADDTKSRQDVLFSIITQRFEDRLRYWTVSAEKNEGYAVSRGLNFLADIRGYCKFAEEQLGQGHPLYLRMCNRGAEFANYCALLAGTGYEKWDEAIRLFKQAIPFAQSPSLKRTMIDNLGTAQDHYRQRQEQDVCWFCKAPSKPASALTFKMFGDIQTETQFLSQKYRTKWRTCSVAIPRCQRCATKTVDKNRLLQYPPIAQKLREGFREGERPSEKECNLHYIMTQKALLWKKSKSWNFNNSTGEKE